MFPDPSGQDYDPDRGGFYDRPGARASGRSIGPIDAYSYVHENTYSYAPNAHGPLTARTDLLMSCMAQCTGRDLIVTSANDGVHSGPTDPHFAGQAVDIGKNSNQGLTRSSVSACYTQCTAEDSSSCYGQEESNHFHLQTRPGRHNSTGFAPGVH